jgi:ATP-dependent Lon protease
VLALKDTVVYPDSMTPLLVSGARAAATLEQATREDSTVVLVGVRTEDQAADDAQREDLFDVGTEAVVHRLIRVPDGTVRALVQGVARVQLGNTTPPPAGRKASRASRRDAAALPLMIEVSPMPDTGDADTTEVRALLQQLLQVFAEVVEHAPYLPEELRMVAGNVEDPAELAHLVASTVRLRAAEKQQVLEAADIAERMRMLLRLLSRELEVLELGSRIQSEVHVEMSRTQREWFLRQQLKQIQEELGDGSADEVAELRTKLGELDLPEVAERQVERELARMARTPEQAAEHGVVRSYLEWIASLPWNTVSEDNLDLVHARAILDEDHYGLERVKERILDYLAVSRLKGGDLAGAILCFTGPPGVGKTSLGRSIARATGRQFARMSVGGMRDEAEIRGHRRTYIGAMPGVVVRGLRDAGTRNPVFMVDEIDKMGADWRGDPSSAMLEVLDPEQNSSFRDHYLDLPFDLSRALFICTANRVDTIPAALRDRMEIIELEGYTEDEKVEIARSYLVPHQLDEHGLGKRQLRLPAKTLRELIRNYTREAGVRELDRQIAAVARRTARTVAEGAKTNSSPTPEDLRGLLGRRRFFEDVARRTAVPGVATGLAVTGAGGDILFIEAAMVPGHGKVQVTGQIGSVMQESAQAAVSWLRATAAAQESDVSREFFDSTDIHIHVPAGAIPKDGPSAGVAMATALASLYRDVPVRSDIAMTGELTLTGDVLPVGGVRDKCLAAQRAGIRHVIVPSLNEGDVEEIPSRLAKHLTFHVVDRIEQVLDLALGNEGSRLPTR